MVHITQMLHRYRNAARNGVSVQQFSDRLLPILLAAVRENNSDDGNNKENLKKEEDSKDEANEKDWERSHEEKRGQDVSFTYYVLIRHASFYLYIIHMIL